MGSREGVGAAGGHGRRGQRALPDVPVGRGADLERFLGIRGTVEKKGLFCGKVDKSNPAQFGRAMIAELGIDMIPAYSPEWRGARSGRSARTRGACRGSWRWPGSWTWRLRTVTSGTCTCQRSTPSSRAPRGGRGSCRCPTPACWTTSCARCTSGRWVTIGRHLTLRGAVAAVAGQPAPTALHEGAGAGQAAYGRTPVRVARAEAAVEVRPGCRTGLGIAPGGGLGWA